MATVELKEVSKIYSGGVQAVNRINLTIKDREFVVLVGPSGCGKTTTLRMVAGLEDISEGTLSIDGRIVNDIAPKDRDIAMVFQNYALYPHMSVYKNMAFSLQLRRHELGLTKQLIDQRVRQAAAILGLTDYLQRKPKALSGGQRQRVAVGRAIVRNPKVFLFDEPLSNLDAKLRVETRSEIKKLHLRLQTTTIYVTHDQEEAMTLGDRIVVMKDGLIQQCAPPLEVYDHPVNQFVASFVGTPPMNFITGNIHHEQAFVYGDQTLWLPEKLTKNLSGNTSGPMVLGVRPEAISLGHEGRFAGANNSLRGTVSVIEPLGDKADIYFTLPNQPPMVCRTETHHLAGIHPQSPACFFVAMEKCHLFDAAGRNVSSASTGRVMD
ncbi:MAG: ABC transporter ATP-binding protein [Phycisphaerae bacterium]